MPSLASILKPTSKSIQKEYVDKRLRELYKNDPQKTTAVQKKVEQAMQAHAVTGDWHDVYLRIHAALQSRPLTINFEAFNWFMKENNYDTYAQMYERGVGANGKMVLPDTDPKNPAVPRAMADDLVTLPEEWANAYPFTQRKRLYDALNMTGTSLDAVKASKKGVTVDNSDKAVKLRGDSASGYRTTNKDFKPRAKQVFAGLNYGQRPHGSCVYYGYSYLILSPALKERALYYPRDTFFLATSGTSTQATFNTIGALMQYAGMAMMDDLWNSCYGRSSLLDTDDGADLIEAHIFKRLKIAEDVQSMHLSRKRKRQHAAITDSEWETIQKNAYKWGQRNSVRVVINGG